MTNALHDIARAGFATNTRDGPDLPDMASRTAARTIVLIHGLWVTPRSWELFRRYYTERGYRVLAPPWPRLHGEVEDIRRDPGALTGLGLGEIVAHYQDIVGGLEQPSVLIGHSFGGLVVQMLLDRGFGTAGVAIDSAPPKGVWQLSLSQIKSLIPVLANPTNYWGTTSLTHRQFHYAFANTMGEGEARAAFARYTIPSPGRPVFQAAFANLDPWPTTAVNYTNDKRPPLLLIAGSDDHVTPPAVVWANYHAYARSRAVTSVKLFPCRSHLLIAQDGWQEVAEFALSWAKDQIQADVGRNHTAARAVQSVSVASAA